jgi:hypothetical protein
VHERMRAEDLKDMGREMQNRRNPAA